MADVAALVEDVGCKVTAGPVKHGVGVDDEVVVARLVDDVIVGEHSETLEPVAALDVTCNHAHCAERRSLEGVQQRDQRRLRHHRFESGDQRWIRAAPDYFQRYPLCHLVERSSAHRRNQADQVGQHRQEDVDVLPGEQRAARRGSAAHEALDPKLLLRNQLGEPFQLPTIVCIGLLKFGILAVETREEIRADRRQRHEIADQPAARMRDDADTGVARQCAEQIDGVVDRAVTQRAVFEGVDAIAELLTERLPLWLRLLT